MDGVVGFFADFNSNSKLLTWKFSTRQNLLLHDFKAGDYDIIISNVRTT